MSGLPEPQDATYDHALYGSGKPWRGILAILSFVAGFLVLSGIFGIVAVIIDIATGTTSIDTLTNGLVPITPVVMLANNVSIAAALPLAMLLQRAFFGVRFRTLLSVAGSFRWRWFGRLALVIVPVWAIYIGISFVLEPGGTFRLDGTTIALLVIVLVTTPFQAAGEEAGARGLIQRSAGSWFKNPTVAFIVSTVIAGVFFTLAHFAADPWLIAYYFVFAASASISARGTGGLEAPILVHAVNNVLIFVPTILLGQRDASFDRSEGVGDPSVLIGMALCLGAAAFSTWWARRRGLQTTVAIPLRMPRPLTPERFQQHASSFDSAADVYERARPSYPADAVDWLLESNPETSVDLGAGTGKFTRLIQSRTRVIAIDPSENMLSHIDGEKHVGTGEAIPLPDSSVDAVFCAQAWHWVDPVKGAAEVARVLKPGGTLGLIWNVRDDREPWIAAMGHIIHDGPSAELKEFPPTLGERFGPIEFYETSWTHDLDRDEIAELVASRSHFLVQDASAQAVMLRELRTLLDTHSDTVGRQRIPVPYRTFAYRAATIDLPADKGAAS